MKTRCIIKSFLFAQLWLIMISLSIGTPVHAQKNCDTFLGTISDPDNDCAPCINGMQKLLLPYLHHQQTINAFNAMNQAFDDYLDKEQHEIDALIKKQKKIDRVLSEWNIQDLNGQPSISEVEYLKNTISDMRDYAKRFPETAEWMQDWISRFESIISTLESYQTLTAQANALSAKIKNHSFGNLQDIKFDCCPDAVGDGKFSPHQLDGIDQLLAEQDALNQALIDYRSRLMDETVQFTEWLEAILSQRAKEEKKAYERRDEFANGVSGFLVAKMQSMMKQAITQQLQNMGYELSPDAKAAIKAFCDAASNAAGAMASGGGLGGVSGEAAGMITEQAFDNLSENDKKALSFITNAVFSQIASAVVDKMIQDAIKSSLGNFLFKGLENNAGLPLMLLDRLLTVAPYLWEDKNRMILQGGFDRILLGLLQGIRLAQGTSRFPDAGPLQAFTDGIKEPNQRAIEICLPQQTIEPLTAEAMKNAFLKTAFPGQFVESFSGNDVFEKIQNGSHVYLEYKIEPKLRLKIRFGCFCGKETEKTAYVPPSITPPWNTISLTGANMKPYFIPVATGNSTFPIIPVIAGTAVTGALVYLITKKKDEPADCAFSATLIPSSSSCNMANGNVMVNTNVDAYYIWSNGSTSKDLVNVTAGLYTVTISRMGTNCTQVLSATVSNINLPINTSLTFTDADCGMQNGSVTPTVDPPGTYSYLWSNGSNDQAQENLAAGTYSLTVSAGGTCEDVVSVTINELPPSFEVTLTSMPATCGTANGAVNTTVDPQGSYEFQWSDGSTGPGLQNVLAGEYTVTVTKTGSTCQVIRQSTIEELPPSFSISFSSTPANCGMSDGSAQASLDPPGNYTYLWSDGQTTAQLGNVKTGTYTLTVTLDGTNCVMNSSITIGELPPAFTLTTSSTMATCGQSDGSAIVLVDLPGEYEYFWSNGQTTSQITGLTAGVYSITVTLAGTACSQNGQITVSELPPSFTLSFLITPSACGEGTGTATVSVDPPGAYTIQWSNGQNGPQAIDLSPGVYLVSVSIPGASCMIQDSVTIQQITPSFTGSITVVPADCGLTNGSAVVTIDPTGNYSYVWSDLQTGATLQNVMAGTYTVTVTDSNSCTATYSTEIPAIPSSFVEIVSSMSASCIGGGEISFSLSTNGPGPLEVHIFYSTDTLTLSLNPGDYLLSSFLSILPGIYQFMVFDQGIGISCMDNASITVNEQTPVLTTNDDFYITTGEQPVVENMLVNDSGLNIQTTSVSNFIGGNVTFDASGNFTYTPDPGFSGEGSFEYTVMDACGNISTAMVTIMVEIVSCNFTITTTLISAHCGLEDGYINVEVNEPGTYDFLWDTGDIGQELDNTSAGSYTVTIEDVNLGCALVFTIDLPEYPVDYIGNVDVSQPTCSSDGEIQFLLTTPLPDDIATLLITHPNGTHLFSVDPGLILISDYVAVVPGDYSIQVYIGSDAPQCIDEVEVTLNTPVQLEISVEAVFPPSSPSAMDGSATIVVVVPGTFPYTIFVDGLPTSTANANTFTVGGMGIGDHTIQIQDASGCISNLAIVTIPFPDIILSLGTVLMNSPTYISLPESLPSVNADVWRVGMAVRLEYKIHHIVQRLQLAGSPEVFLNQHSAPGIWMIEQRSQLTYFRTGQFAFHLEGGMGCRFIPGRSGFPHSTFLSLASTFSLRLEKYIHLEGEFGLRGWEEMEPLYVMLTLRIYKF